MSEEQKKKTEEKAQEAWWREILQPLKKNRKGIAAVAAAAVVLLGIGVALGALIGGRDGSAAAGNETAAGQTQQAEGGTEAAGQDVPLEENAYPEINALIEQYYQAAAAGDIEAIKALKDESEQTELLQIQEKSRYLENYEDINCYTKPGPQEGSFVVYASYYAKFRDIDQKVCGLNTFVVCQDEQGGYYIHDCSQDEAMKEYRVNVTKQADVVELFNRVQVEYNETVTENPELAAFLTEMSDELKASVSEALAGMETEAATETADMAAAEAQGSEEGQGEEGQEEEGQGGSMVEATDVVNIRSSDSEEADILGKAQIGDQFALLEEKGNGWSRIEYEGQEAYIKTEFLTAAGGEGQEDTQLALTEDGQEGEEAAPLEEEEAEDSDGAAASAGQEAGEAAVPNSGTYRLTTTVNVRKSASESADRLGVGYSGDEVEILMKQADGWTKVRFNGEVGYIKTEVLR